jgi:integrase
MLALSRAGTNRPARLAVRIAFYSGLRLGEILRAQIRGQTFYLFYLMDTKNGDPRDLFIVGRVLGHKDPRSTQRYSHLAIDTLTAAVGKIGKRSG